MGDNSLGVDDNQACKTLRGTVVSDETFKFDCGFEIGVRGLRETFPAYSFERGDIYYLKVEIMHRILHRHHWKCECGSERR